MGFPPVMLVGISMKHELHVQRLAPLHLARNWI